MVSPTSHPLAATLLHAHPEGHVPACPSQRSFVSSYASYLTCARLSVLQTH